MIAETEMSLEDDEKLKYTCLKKTSHLVIRCNFNMPLPICIKFDT